MSESPLICVDLDGTLEDSRIDMVNAVHRVRVELGLPERSDDELRPWMSKGMPKLYANCFSDYDGDADTLRAAYETEYMANVCHETKLYPGIGKAMGDLREIGTLVVVTNKPERISRRLIDALQLADLFSDVVGGDSCEHAKPHPVMLETAAARVGCDGAATLMIGDSAGDIKLGRAFGAKTIWVAWGYADSPGDLKPDFVAEAASQLPRLVSTSIKR